MPLKVENIFVAPLKVLLLHRKFELKLIWLTLIAFKNWQLLKLICSLKPILEILIVPNVECERSM